MVTQADRKYQKETASYVPAESSVVSQMKAVSDAVEAIRFGEITVAPGLIGAGAEVTTNTALPAGYTASVGDLVVMMHPSALEAGIYIRAADVAVADQIRAIWRNETAAGVTPASRAYTFVLIQHKRPVPLF